MKTDNDAERIVLLNAREDYGLLWQILDEVRGSMPGAAPEAALRAAREAVFSLVAKGMLDVYRRASRRVPFVRLDAAAFARAPKISIDYAVMERTARAGVLPVSFAWSDVGTWDAVWQVLDHDEAGNAVRGRVSLIGTKNSLVHSQGEGLTAVVGLEDVVVVSTPDAVLVASKAHSGQVKELVGALRARGEPEADAHLRMYRSTGWWCAAPPR